MNAVTPLTITTPDGVERTLRFTLGARRRISEQFSGMSITEILDKYDAGALPHILWALMHDERGQPPADISIEWLAENIHIESTTELMAVIMSAATQGKTSKKELEARLNEALLKPTLTTSSSGPSLISDLESGIAGNSGGAS